MKIDEKLVQEKVKEIDQVTKEYEDCVKKAAEYQELNTQCRLQTGVLYERKRILERELIELLK